LTQVFVKIVLLMTPFELEAFC